MTTLDVFLEGITTPVGELTRQDSGELTFRYVQDRLPHPISLSLPVREEAYGDVIVRAFFNNLLFENALRDQLMQRYQLDRHDIVGLLARIGRDCPGAISVVPKGEGPNKVPGNLDTDYEALGDLEGIMGTLSETSSLLEAVTDPSPIAGVQSKIALAVLPDGRFAVPRRGVNVPTTHILKVPRSSDMRMAGQEHAAMKVARHVLRHPVAKTKVVGTGSLQGLLIARFDREITGTRVKRIHQEDFCQALGLPPLLKYQRNGTGTRELSATRIGTLLDQLEAPAAARLSFLEAAIINLALLNNDNHAKNHALLYLDSRPRLAPFFDIVPTLLDTTTTQRLSFDIGSARRSADITADDLEAFVRALGFRRMIPRLKKRLAQILEETDQRISELSDSAESELGLREAISEQVRVLRRALE